MILRISWKNVWRNKQRSLIVIAAVIIGTVAGIFLAGLMKGWTDQRVQAAIFTETSHIKVQNPNYLNNEEIRYTLPDVKELEDFFNNSDAIKNWTKRTNVVAMAATSRGSAGVTLKGIYPEKEMLVSDLNTHMVEDGGNYFESTFKNPIVISDRLAEELRIKTFSITQKLVDSLIVLNVPHEITTKIESFIGKRYYTKRKFKRAFEDVLTANEVKSYGANIIDLASNYKLRSKIVFTFTDLNGQMTYQSFRVCGIYKTSNAIFDVQNAFVLNSDLAGVAGLSDTDYHEIAAIVNEEVALVEQVKNEAGLKFENCSVLSWKELAPDAAMMSEIMGIYYYIIMLIIFMALAFGIINTMLMAIMERIKEIGMLMAIGMNKKRVFTMIMSETLFLTLTGSVIGMGLGALLIAITNKTGLDFSTVGDGFESMGFAAIVYPNLDFSFFVGITLLIIVIGVLSSLVPARKALKLNPVEAIRIE